MSAANDSYDPKEVAALAPETLEEAVVAAGKAFEEAEKNSPAIIFIDEIDSIAPKREKVRVSFGMQLPRELTIIRRLTAKSSAVLFRSSSLSWTVSRLAPTLWSWLPPTDPTPSTPPSDDSDDSTAKSTSAFPTRLDVSRFCASTPRT